MNIEGKWKVRYAVEQESPFTSEEGDSEEIGEVTFESGKVFGSDPFGGFYDGTYLIEREQIKAFVLVYTNEEDSESIFEELKFPYNLELEGNFSSPNHFSMTGNVLEHPAFRIVLNCERI